MWSLLHIDFVVRWSDSYGYLPASRLVYAQNSLTKDTNDLEFEALAPFLTVRYVAKATFVKSLSPSVKTDGKVETDGENQPKYTSMPKTGNNLC